MFIVALEGGLGNQMFQYAFYLALQEHYKQTEMKVDLSLINPNIHNGYELQRLFHIFPETCSKKETLIYSDYCPYSITGATLFNLLFGIHRRLLGRKKTYIWQRDSTEYIKKCFELDGNKNYYFRGVWANYKYFAQYEKIIKETFSFPQITDAQNLKWKELIENSNSVSIHFRGGDYYKSGFAVLTNNYYAKAIEWILSQVENPVFFVFTDDVENAKKNIPVMKRCNFIVNNRGVNNYVDMQLMAMCRHNIIANSTFSFWGAYLNKNPNKTVIAPDKAVGSCSFPYQCEGWILL